MSYVKTDTFALPSDKDSSVTMKRRLSAGDWMAGMNFYRAYAMPAAEGITLQLATADRNVATSKLVLVRSILDWNLTDANDEPIPITEDGLTELVDEDLTFLMQKAAALFTGRPAEAEAPFGNRSGKRSRATRSRSHRS